MNELLTQIVLALTSSTERPAMYAYAALDHLEHLSAATAGTVCTEALRRLVEDAELVRNTTGASDTEYVEALLRTRL